MRKLVDFLLDIYFYPLRASKRLLLYAKGKLIPANEHFLITIDVIRKHFKNDRGLIIDAGAFDADSTVLLAKAFPGNQVIGFEPNPGPFQQACLNASKFQNIKMENMGLANEVGQMDFYVTNDYVSSSLYDAKSTSEFSFAKKIQIKTSTLDQYLGRQQDILLLKLDVQGGELQILKGATNTILKTKLILTEVLIADLYKGGCKYFEVDEMLRANDFYIYSIITNYNNDGTKYFDILYINSRFHSC